MVCLLNFSSQLSTPPTNWEELEAYFLRRKISVIDASDAVKALKWEFFAVELLLEATEDDLKPVVVLSVIIALRMLKIRETTNQRQELGDSSKSSRQ